MGRLTRLFTVSSWQEFLHSFRSSTTSCQAWRCRCISGATYYWSLQPLRYGQFLLPNPLRDYFLLIPPATVSVSFREGLFLWERPELTSIWLFSLSLPEQKKNMAPSGVLNQRWKRKTDQMVLVTRPESRRADPKRSFGCSTSGVGTRWWLRGTLGLPGSAKSTPS